MRVRTWSYRSVFLMALLLGGSALLSEIPGARLSAAGFPHRLSGPSHSGPIAVTPDDRFVWVADPDNDQVTLIDARDDANRVLAKVDVGDQPQNLAVSPDGKRVYVSNTGSGTVSVIKAESRRPRVVETIRVGTEPYGLAFTPNGDKLYVANARSNDVSVIDPDNNHVIRTIAVGPEPRGVAVTNDGDKKDRDEKVYVTRFLGVDRPGVLIGADDYKEGRVTVISARNDKVIGEVVLNPIQDTGFKSAGSVLKHIAATEQVVTAAFPNQLNSVAIKGDRAYLPNTGASPDAPIKFNVKRIIQKHATDIEERSPAQKKGQFLRRTLTSQPPAGQTIGPNCRQVCDPAKSQQGAKRHLGDNGGPRGI